MINCKAAVLLAVLLFSMVIIQVSSAASNQEHPAVSLNRNYSLRANSEQLKVVDHKITASELENLKSAIGVYEEGRDYNQLVDGYGTGLAPPSEEEWAEIAQNSYVVDEITYGAAPPSVDLSATPWFPPIGNQANQGSCVAWSVGYYVKTYQEAKERSWDLSGATWQGGYSGYPTVSYQDKIISPAFIYNLINKGVDEGSSFRDAIQLVCFVGASSWQKKPYNRLNYTSWPSEAAWAEAPYYRGNSSGYQTMTISSTAGISNLKTWLAAGNLATLAVDANKFSSLNSVDAWTLDNYNPSEANHAVTIVGYDDNFSYTEAGQTRYGAFKVANSWGVGFTGEKVADGFFWISYEAMRQRVSKYSQVMFFYDRVGYEPELLATFQITHPMRSECQITVGLGTQISTITSKRFDSYVFGGTLPFPSNSIVFDITEFKAYISVFYNQPFCLKVYDGGTYRVGNITYFAINNTTSSETPRTTIQGGTVYSTLYYSTYQTSLTVSPTSGPPTGSITLDGVGFTTDSTVNLAYLNPITSTWVPIVDNLPTVSQTFTYTTNAPDLMQTNPSGDQMPLFDNIVFRAQDNSNGQTYDTAVPYTQWRRGLTQVGSAVAVGLYGNNTDLSSTIRVQAGQSIVVSGKWFSSGTASLLWDGTVDLGTVAIDGAGAFTAAITVPLSGVAGMHTITVVDASTRFVTTVRRLPVLTAVYDGAWRSSDFTVSINADGDGISEIYYRINQEPTQSVSVNGQPLITQESSNNTLEYWGTWTDGAATVELANFTLTGIKLDKTPPEGSFQINGGVATTASTAVTLTVTAADSLSGISQIRFSNDQNFNQAQWESYVGTKSWQLASGDGVKTVYCQIKDNAGSTATFSSQITLQSPSPTPSPTPTPTQQPTPTPTQNPTSTPTPIASPTQSASSQPTATPPIPELPPIMAIFSLISITIALSVGLKRKTQTKR